MTTIMEAAKGILSTYVDDEPKSPIHVGEVMNLWTYHTVLTEINRFVEMSLNTTRDDELVVALKNSYNDCRGHIQEVESLFRDEGIPLPPTSEKKPHSNPEDVPLGVKMTDDEIANGISVKQVSTLTLCATGLAQSIRSDIGEMWLRFLTDRVKFGAYFMPLLRKRGWIKVPPSYYPPGAPQH
ncbi:DUF3231 family protein [Desulforamulus aquiferis]|uniref:DUF3231 family protein n=1 Tax=Desulforamulus aquiferis TaxID=1397668 RepID=A0AAW7ZA03_9FIRM|nr:DUF3231 family protein [Desulforamulus aquiferis]MDO7786548.1 DUF3231 family protein [Desulforamulus aquiferis]